MSSPSDERDPLFDNPAFFHITRTNEPPHPAEEAILLQTIKDLKSKIVQADNSLLSTHGQKDIATARRRALQAEKRKVLQAIQRREIILSAVRRLPAEILGIIFLYTTVFPGASEPEDNTKWSISRVCRMWRACALGLPRLWSFVRIFDDSSGADYFNMRVARMATQLKLSRREPLVVSVSLTDSVAGNRLGRKAVTLLLEYAQRIRWMVLDLPPAVMGILLPLRGHLDSLTHLDIINEAGTLPDAPFAVFDKCPKLLDLVTSAAPDPDDILTMPWNTITHYIGYIGTYIFLGTSVDSALYILSQAPNMVKVTFRLISLRGGSSYAVECPKLRCLSLSDADLRERPDFEELFNRLTLPKLSDFAIHLHPKVGTRMKEPEVFTSIARLIERSRSPLTRFIYHNGYILSVDVARLLRAAAPTLRTFALHRVEDVDDEIVREVFNVKYCLDEVTLTGCLQFDPHLFLKILLARWQVRPLHRLELGWVPSPSFSWERATEALKVISAGVQEICISGLVFSGSVLRPTEIW